MPKSQYSQINIIGAASGIGAKIVETAMGPSYMKASSLLQNEINRNKRLHWQEIISIDHDQQKSNKIHSIAAWSSLIAKQTYDSVKKSQPFIVLGGDHSCAIGTWSGAFCARRNQGDSGLIWIDAHLDSHTFDTSISKSIHGMPVACLLGYGDDHLTQISDAKPKIKPQHLCIIGARSYEDGEYELLTRLGVRIFFMSEVQERGLKVILQEAMEIVKGANAGFGITIDLDAIDPKDAPGTGSPEPNGLSSKELIQNLADLSLMNLDNHNNFLGLEIAEFNPNLDQNHITEQLICYIIKAIFTKD
jgi:arginase